MTTNTEATWPDSATGGELGDGRFAYATDRPPTLEALAERVALRASDGVALYPQGGRTALDFGGIPRDPGVAIDLRALDRVVDYPASDMTITVEAGITLEKLRETLAREGQRLCLDAPRPERATLGGIYATNACGPNRFALGRPRDQIIGVRFVDSGGQILKGGGRVVKNVAGYDLPKLLTGSMGTLGILAELTLKVRPLPETSVLAWIRFKSLLDASRALDRLTTSGTRPVALELMNEPGAARVGQSLGLPVDAWVLAIAYEGNAASVEWQVDRLMLELGRTDLVFAREDEAARLNAELVESQAGRDSVVSFLVNLRPSRALEWLGLLDQGRWSLQAHAGDGIIRAHLRPGEGMDELGSEVDRLRADAVRLGGNLTLPRCPTAWKGRLRVWGQPRDDGAVASRIKQALDPRGLLNPGRFVGSI
jgi:glycolate oxidase FAD binding subunit